MDNESLSYKTIKNAVYGFIGYAWPIIFSIAITPVVVHRLGVVDYGVFVLLNTITAFLNLLDLGLASSLIKFVSEYHATGQEGKLKSLLGSASSLYLIVGTAGFFVFWAIGQFFLPVFKVSAQSQEHLGIVFALAGLVFFLNAANYAYMVVPMALQRYDLSTKMNLFQLTLFNLGMLLLVVFGFKLKAIYIMNIAAVCGLIMLSRHYYRKLLPSLSFGYQWDKQELKKSYRFGIFAAINTLATVSLMQLDRLIIPIFTGTAQLTYYTLPGNVAQKTSGITGSLGFVLFPLASALSGQGEAERLKNAYKKIFRNITLIAAAFSSAIAFFGYQILQFWIGKDFADKGYGILVVLAITYLVLSIYSPLTSMLMGLGRVRFLTYISLALAAINLALLLALVPRYGIAGAAWAYLFGVLPIPLVFYWTEREFLQLENMGSFYLKLYSKLLLTAGIYFILVKLVLLKLVVNLPSLVIVGPASILLFLGMYKLFGFMEEEDWQIARVLLSKLLQRFRYH